MKNHITTFVKTAHLVRSRRAINCLPQTIKVSWLFQRASPEKMTIFTLHHMIIIKLRLVLYRSRKEKVVEKFLSLCVVIIFIETALTITKFSYDIDLKV